MLVQIMIYNNFTNCHIKIKKKTLNRSIAYNTFSFFFLFNNDVEIKIVDFNDIPNTKEER